MTNGSLKPLSAGLMVTDSVWAWLVAGPAAMTLKLPDGAPFERTIIIVETFPDCTVAGEKVIL